MNEFFDKLFEGKSPEEMVDTIVRLNRFQLNRKTHIKKYNKIRKLHSVILDSMENYIFNSKYDFKKYINMIMNDLKKVVKDLDIEFDLDDPEDIVTLSELLIYNNHPKIETVTDIYIKKKRFKTEEKNKMLESMKNSYIGLFEVVDVDRWDGYVTLQDIFTKKTFKIIDIALSSSCRIDENKKRYLYSRIITYEDISFSSGLHYMFTSNSKEFLEFIDSKKYQKYDGFVNCLVLYDLFHRDSSVQIVTNHNYK